MKIRCLFLIAAVASCLSLVGYSPAVSEEAESFSSFFKKFSTAVKAHNGDFVLNAIKYPLTQTTYHYDILNYEGTKKRMKPKVEKKLSRVQLAKKMKWWDGCYEGVMEEEAEGGALMVQSWETIIGVRNGLFSKHLDQDVGEFKLAMQGETATVIRGSWNLLDPEYCTRLTFKLINGQWLLTHIEQIKPNVG